MLALAMQENLIRHYENKLESFFEEGKVIIIYGPRRVGKTTLLKSFIKTFKGKTFFSTGEDLLLKQIFAKQSVQELQSYFTEYDLVVIDEAQQIPNIGLGLKLLIDHLPNLKIIATGSASFDLSNKVGEPLTGRQKTLLMYPLSIYELSKQFDKFTISQSLEERIVFGSYPEIFFKKSKNQKSQYLSELRNSHLLKDLLQIENVRYSDKLFDLLTLLAFQIGSEVSLNELSNNLDISKQVVERYLYLLEKSFIIIKVRGFSRNLRKEVSKSHRYYFIDNGVRNSVINNFNDIKLRDDIGQLWENFIFSERLKTRQYKEILANQYFWRTYDQREIDLVEEREGSLFGYEFKWSEKKTPKAPNEFISTYKNSSYSVITPGNMWEFLASSNIKDSEKEFKSGKSQVLNSLADL